MKNFLKVMKAISDSNRVKILKMLQHKTMCVCEMREALKLAQPTVSKHLKLLEDAGLVGSSKDGMWVNYNLADGASSPFVATILGNLKHWLDDEPEISQLVEKLPSINLNEIIKQTNLEKDVFRKNVANNAIGCLGIGYKYGGTNKSGFDCSGFVQYVYGKNGVKTPRTVTEMANSINKTNNPQRGDLIVINGYEHIGIYLNDGNFIHSSSSQGIMISSVDEEYYRNKITCYLTVF